MVKGISRQVIVVQAPDPKLFEQAIFILRDDALGAEGITDELLLKEAKKLIGQHKASRRKVRIYGPVWAAAGAFATGLVWVLTTLF